MTPQMLYEMRMTSYLCAFLILTVFTVANASVTLRVFHTSDIHGRVNGRPHEPNYNGTLADYRALLDIERARGYNNGYGVVAFDSGGWTQGSGFSDGTDPPGHAIVELYSMLGLTAFSLGTTELNEDLLLRWIAGEQASNKFPSLVSSGTEFYGGADFPHNGSLGSNFLFMNPDNVDDDFKIGVFGFPNPRGKMTEGVHTPVPKNFIADNSQRIEQECPGLIFVLMDQMLVEGSSQPLEQREILSAIRQTGFCGKNAVVSFMNGHSGHWRYIDHCSDANGVRDDACIGVESWNQFSRISRMDISLEKKMVDDGNGGTRAVWRWLNDLPAARSPSGGIVTSKTDMAKSVSVPEADLVSEGANNISNAILKIAKSYNLLSPIGCSTKRYWRNMFYSFNYSLEYLYLQDVWPETVVKVAQKENLIGICTHGKAPTPLLVMHRYAFQYDLFNGHVTLDDAYSSLPYPDSFLTYPCVPGKVVKEFLKYNNEGLDPYDANYTIYNPLWLPSIIPDMIEDNELYLFTITQYIDTHWPRRIIWASDKAGVPRSAIPAQKRLTSLTTDEALISYIENYMTCQHTGGNDDDNNDGGNDDGNKDDGKNTTHNKSKKEGSHLGTFFKILFIFIIIVAAVVVGIHFFLRWRRGYGIDWSGMWDNIPGLRGRGRSFQAIR